MSHTFRQQPTVSRSFPVLDSRFSPNYDPIISITKTIILSFNKFSLEIEIMSSQKMPHNPVPKVVAFRSLADFFHLHRLIDFVRLTDDVTGQLVYDVIG